MPDIHALFAPIQLGDVRARNRIAVAPCSRHRALLDGTPSEMMVEYYRARASAGLIIAEATACSAMGTGYLFVPGLHTDSHVAGWRRVTDAVHAEGGTIFLQLNHVGRLSDPLILPGNTMPLAPSAVQPDPLARHYTRTCPRPMRPYGTPRAMDDGDVETTIDDFANAARRARDAGFDGVEIHGASGYLVMQFLCPNSNQRTDAYGGDIARRARFLLECVERMQAATSPGFVAVKLGPGWTYHDVFDDDAPGTCAHCVRELSDRRIAYLQIGNFGQDWDVYGVARPLFDGPMMGVKGFSRAEAAQTITSGLLDMVAFGQAYIANPDLVERFRSGTQLNRPRPELFYTQGAEGYLDYPTAGAGDPDQLADVDATFSAGASGVARKAFAATS